MPFIQSTASRAIAKVAFICIAAYVCVASLLYAQSAHKLIVDEFVYVPQIGKFYRGDWLVDQRLAVIPGYHLLMAGIARLLDLNVAGLRAVGLFFGFCGAYAFYGIRKHLGDIHAARSAALFFFLPILFPFYFLIYTDALSVTLVMFAMWASLKNKHVLSAIVLVMSILVRQNNVVWALFLATLTAWPDLKLLFQQRAWSTFGKVVGTKFAYALPMVVLAAFWAWNGTLAMSTAASQEHPGMTLHAGNIYYALLLYLIFFPSDVWRGMGSFYLQVKTRPWLLLIPIAVIACSKVHGSPSNYVSPDRFLHNGVMSAVQQGGWLLAAFAVLTSMAACSLYRPKLAVAHGRLYFPFATLYLGMSWLVETRYAILPLALWMAIRANSPDRDERISLIAWMAISSFLVYGIFDNQFMV